MAKLTSKREKGRNWTASTFLPDSSNNSDIHSHSNSIDSAMSTATAASNAGLEAITEDILDDENMLEVEDIQRMANEAPNNTTSITSISNNGHTTARNKHNNDDASSDSQDEDEEDDNDEHDHDHDSHDNEDEDSNSSQDQGTSEDSDDDHDHEDNSNSNSNSNSDDDDADSNNHNHNYREQNGRMDIPKRSRTSLSSKKKRAALSTSPSNSNSTAGKVVSATPSKKITKKSKKCVKSKSSKGALSAAARQATEEAKLEAAKPIVTRFLELENTKLNDKLLQVFMINGMIPYLLESITRLDPEIAKSIDSNMDDGKSQESKFLTHLDHCRRTRDYSDLSLMKKSYTAMNLITRPDVYNEFILSNSHQTIVRELFKVFRPESNGNFHHFYKVFETILKKFRVQTMATVFEDVDPETGASKTPLVFEMLPFLDQPPVALSMTKLLFPTYAYGFTERIRGYYKILQNGHFMEMLLAMVTLTKESSSNMADFVVSLLDEATRAKEAKILFSCLADDPIWAERLVRGVQSPSIVRRNGCIEIIYSVLVRSIQVPFQDMFANTYASEKLFDKVESHLEPIETEFGKHLRCFIPDLCNVFIGSKSGGGEITLPGYTLPCSFTVARLWLLDSVYHCLSDVKEDPSLLELIPEAFWTTLVDSFFHFRFNNAFHVQFYKIFRVVLYSEQAAVYNRFFVNTNLVSRLIEHYMAKSQPTGSKGYIILILNCIRLSADVEKKQQEKEQKSQEDGDSIDGCNKSPLTTDDQRKGTISPMFWTDLIRSNPEWEDFQETLRTATLEQTRDTLCHMDPNLRFQFAPLQSRQPNETPLTRRHFGIPGVSARGNDGIDLGSKYGNSLGFGVPMKYDHEAAEKDKEKTEQDQESRVQKALANLMPTMDWKLIPPQRVLNAMGGGITRANAPGKLKQLQTNGHNTSSASAVAISPMNNNSNNDITASTTNVNGNTSSSTTPNGTSTSTSAKSKKKKKNKKKRPNSIDHTEDHFDSADSSEQTNGVSSSSSEEMVNDSGSSSACSSDDDESSSATSFEKNYVVEHPESNGNGPESTTTTTMDIDEERRERKREKNRQKKWKYKMNKKNKIHQLQAEAEENVGETGSAMEQ